MPKENVEIVRQAFEGWNRGEFDAIVRRVAHEDVELHIVGGLSDLVGETFAGHTGVIRVEVTTPRVKPSKPPGC